jgi:Spy/CpxP family protein refolding chaperone
MRSFPLLLVTPLLLAASVAAAPAPPAKPAPSKATPAVAPQKQEARAKKKRDKPGREKREGGSDKLDRTLFRQLDLSDEQKARLRQAEEARRDAEQRLRAEYAAALKGILTSEQQLELALLTEELKELEPLGRTAYQLVGLELSNTQRAKILAIAARYGQQAEALRAKTPDPRDRAVRDQVDALMEKRDREVLALLTPEQRERFSSGGKRKKQKTASSP